MPKVIIYTSQACIHCKNAKNYFKENNIEFEEKRIDQDRDAMNDLIQRGHRSVPIIEIDGEEVVGFDQSKIQRLLNL